MTKIPHEIQEWDDATGKLVLWFKEDVLHNVDTGGFIYYDKPASTDQQDSINVWTDNHHIVYICLKHLPGWVLLKTQLPMHVMEILSAY